MVGNGEHLHSYTIFGTTDVMASGSCRWATGQLCSPADPVTWYQHINGFVLRSHLFGISRTQNLFNGCVQGCFPLTRTCIMCYQEKNTLSPVLCEGKYSHTHRRKRNYLKGRPRERDRIIHQLGLCTGVGASTQEKYGILFWVQQGVTVKS